MTARTKFKTYNSSGMSDRLTLKEIGVIVGVSGERARQILESGLKKMRQHMKLNGIEFLDLISESDHEKDHTYYVNDE